MSNFVRPLFDRLQFKDDTTNPTVLVILRQHAIYPERENNYATISLTTNKEEMVLEYVPLTQIRLIQQLVQANTNITKELIDALENMWNQAYDIAGNDYHMQNADESL